MTRILTAAFFAVLLMMLTACGGGSDSESSSDSSSSSAASSGSDGSGSSGSSGSPGEDDETAAASISDSLMEAQKAGDSGTQLLSMDRKDADCIGKGLVDKVGTDSLQEYGMLTEDLKAGTNLSSLKMSKADAASTTDVVFTCTDVEAMMRSAMGKSGNIPKQLQGCVNKVLTEGNLRPMFAKIFEGKQAAAQKELTAPLLACAKKAQPRR